MKICFIDSGIGGLSVYITFIDKLVQNLNLNNKIDHIYYFADFENSPYGNKTKAELVEIMNKNILNLHKKYGCVMFVLACNTATACTITKLRERFPNFIFIGIEPAVKTAVQAGGNTLVMCTTATYFYSKLLKSYKNAKGVYFLPLSTLANKIDIKFEDDEYINGLIKKYLKNFKDIKINNVVLGCTHYAFLKNAIKKEINDVKFYDSTKGVVKRIINLLNT